MPRKATGRLFKRGKNWCLQWTEGGERKFRSFGLVTKKEAEEFRDEIVRPLQLRAEEKRLKVAESRLRDRMEELGLAEAEVRKNRVKLADAWETYLRSPRRPDAGQATLGQYAYQWKAFTDWMVGHHSKVRHLANVSADIASEYTRHLQDERSLGSGTFNKHVTLCRSVFRVLGSELGLAENPFGDVALKKDRQNHRKELSWDKLSEICDAAQGEMNLLLFLGIYTGLRLKDCCLLPWDEVDLVRGWIIHTPFKTAARHDEPVHIPIHPCLRSMLEGIPSEDRHGCVLPELAAKYDRRRNTVTSAVLRLFKKCDVQVYKPDTGPGTKKKAVLQYGFHSLRHTAVTLLQEAGAPVAVIQALVGHSTRAMTDKYTHVSRTALAAAVSHMPALAEPAGGPIDREAAIGRIAQRLPKATAEQLAEIDRILGG